MDIFVFHNPTDPTKMEQGEIVNGLTSKMWVERYLPAGEFKFTCPPSSTVKDKLPIGSFISHADTSEIMIVENHEITDNVDQDPEMVITGRGFETYFENRIVGSNKDFIVFPTSAEYILAADYTWNQAVQMVKDHIFASNLLDDNDALNYVDVLTTIVGTGSSVETTMKLTDLYSALQSLLAIDALGIKIIRPGPLSIVANTPDLEVVMHKGIDKSSSIVFSYDTSEITTADYLWSNKSHKTAALVIGRWVKTFVDTGPVGYNRRTMIVDASDIDGQFSAAPSGFDLTSVIAAMQQRGLIAIAGQKALALTKVDVSKGTTAATYRHDFDLGDIITVSGDYNQNAPMRVTEYVEIEDDSGGSSYPTLSLL